RKSRVWAKEGLPERLGEGELKDIESQSRYSIRMSESQLAREDRCSDHLSRAPIGRQLNGFRPSLAGTNPNHLFDILYEYLTVADLAGARRRNDCVDREFGHIVVDHDLDPDLRQEIDHVFGTAIQFGMPFLTAKAFHLGNRQAGNVDFGQGFADFVELERFDDGGHLFHGNSPLV